MSGEVPEPGLEQSKKGWKCALYDDNCEIIVSYENFDAGKSRWGPFWLGNEYGLTPDGRNKTMKD